jgi:PAS domain S-box-containing protein
MPAPSIHLYVPVGAPPAAGNASDNLSERPANRAVARVLVSAVAGYAAVAWLSTTLAPANSSLLEFLVDWMALPTQVFAAVACAHAARRWRRAALPARACWTLLCAAATLSGASLIYWNVWEPYQTVPWLAAGDVLYLIDYALIGAALAALFALLGGTLRSPVTWLDGLSILAAVLATAWAMILGPLAPAQPSVAMPWSYASTYGIAAAVLLTLGSLVWMRMPAGAGGLWIVALVGAAFVQAAWIIGWLGFWVTRAELLSYIADYGEVICYSLVSVAALTIPESPTAIRRWPDVRRTAYAFLPTLAMLVAIALISGLLAMRPGAGAWIVAGIVMLGLLLLLTRHSVATAEFERLRDELARRESDERLSELVRQSADGFMVITADGVIAFASPAAETVLCTSAVRLVGSPLATAFGPPNATVVGQFLATVRNRQSAADSLELEMPAESGTPRVVRILAANQLNNPRIRGVTLVVTDVSKERALEREVINVASAERLRLAADVHDGVGQELTGVVLLLQQLVNRAKDGPQDQRQALTELIGHLNHAIGEVRDLAHGLSPLYVVHGSLTRALQALAARTASPRVEVQVDVDPELEDLHIDGAVGDHLYQIAAEAVHNARRHAACTRISLSLTNEPDGVVLAIADNGTGFRADDASVIGRGAGLRLMEYRARVIGAVLQISSRPAVGTRIQATLRHRDAERRHA